MKEKLIAREQREFIIAVTYQEISKWSPFMNSRRLMQILITNSFPASVTACIVYI